MDPSVKLTVQFCFCKLYIWLIHLTYSCIRRQSWYLWKIPIRIYFSAGHLLMRKFVTMDLTLLWRDVIKGNIFIGMFFDSLSLYTFKLSWLCFINPYKTALGWCHQFYRVRFTTLITFQAPRALQAWFVLLSCNISWAQRWPSSQGSTQIHANQKTKNQTTTHKQIPKFDKHQILSGWVQAGGSSLRKVKVCGVIC